MITFEWESSNRILSLKVIGTISEADIDATAENLQKQIPEASVHIRSGGAGDVNLLFDCEELEGWDMGAKTLGTVTSMSMMPDIIRKVAAIADPKWLPEKERLADIYRSAEVRFFKPGQREEAIKWADTRQ